MRDLSKSKSVVGYIVSYGDEEHYIPSNLFYDFFSNKARAWNTGNKEVDELIKRVSYRNVFIKQVLMDNSKLSGSVLYSMDVKSLERCGNSDALLKLKQLRDNSAKTTLKRYYKNKQ